MRSAGRAVEDWMQSFGCEKKNSAKPPLALALSTLPAPTSESGVLASTAPYFFGGRTDITNPGLQQNETERVAEESQGLTWY